MSDTLALHFLQSNRQVTLEGEENIIAGVSDYSSLNLIDYFYGRINTISRKHFKISKTDQGFVIQDLNSRNGIEVNNQLLSPGRARRLFYGDVIKVAQNDNFIIQVVDPNVGSATLAISDPAPKMPDKLGIHFDENESKFIVDGNVIPEGYLSELEERLLAYLYQNAERVCSYRDIARHVWGGWQLSSHTIIVSISRLRRKLNEISPGAGTRYLKKSREDLPGYVLMLK